MSVLQLHMEAMIFSATGPVKKTEMKETLEKVFETDDIEEKQIDILVDKIIEKYKNDAYPFELRKSGGGFQFLTKGVYYQSVAGILKLKSRRRLSKSALETLSIIAYKQPCTKSFIEEIRGVNCDYAIQKLLTKELIKVEGRAESVGKPLLYGTDEAFMDYFGINSKEDLPTLKEFQSAESEIGLPENDEVTKIVTKEGFEKIKVERPVDKNELKDYIINEDLLIDDHELDGDLLQNGSNANITIKNELQNNSEEE